MADMRLPTLNRIFLTGNLTRDPELRYTPSGIPVMNFRLASNRRYRGQDGEWKEEVCYVNVVAWQRLAELCSERLHKGSAVLVDGELQTRSRELESGQRRTIVEVRARQVQFLSRIEEPEGRVEPESGSANQADRVDDLPF
jgi:single-strand DNA-binding protein